MGSASYRCLERRGCGKGIGTGGEKEFRNEKNQGECLTPSIRFLALIIVFDMERRSWKKIRVRKSKVVKLKEES